MTNSSVGVPSPSLSPPMPSGNGEKSLREPALARKSAVPAMAGVALCLILAVGQIALGQYKLGVGNQAIQIAFLSRGADPALFSADRMVVDTMPLYPSYFFRMLAPLLQYTDLATLYLILQIATGFLTLAGVYWLSRSIFRSHAAGLAAVALLVAGHLRALAGDSLYSQGFTHTYAALPIAVGALALAYRGKWLWAFAIAGVLFNIHALTAAYLLLMLGAGLLADLRAMPWWKWGLRSLLCVDIALVLAAPTLLLMAQQHQTFDASWVNLMRIRSADHSFPSTWWLSPNPDLPRFVLIFALFVMSWSFSPVRRGSGGQADGQQPVQQGDAKELVLDEVIRGDAGGTRWGSRVTLLMTLAVLGLFAAGYLFSEIWPVPLVIRLQPFRASRLLMILMLVHIAHGAIVAIRAGAAGTTAGPDGASFRLPLVARLTELIAGVMILATLAVPALLPLLPLTVAVALAAGLVAGHLSWRQSAIVAGALIVTVLANRQIDFPLLPASLTFFSQGGNGAIDDVAPLGWLALFMSIMLAVILGLLWKGWTRAGAIAFAFALGAMLSWGLFTREMDNGGGLSDQYAGVATWAHDKTPKSALFLTPTGFSNFRIQAQRSLVADWRDGTQLYFSAKFGPEWLARVSAIEPGLTLSDDRTRLISRGDSAELSALSDQALIDLAKKFHANYILLPTPAADQARALVAAYSDGAYTAYEPRIPVAESKVPPGVINAAAWNAMENFMHTTVQQNIERYRKADVTIHLVDTAGRPVQELPVKLDQTQQAFVFGCSLGFFEPTDFDSADGDNEAPKVRPIELAKMPEVFNGSMIPFSSKWAEIEPERGVYHWNDLDKYVDYCTQHDITMEFHHLSGVRPEWVARMGGPSGTSGLSFGPIKPDLQAEFNRHCLAVLDRYHDRIKYFQVVNEKYMMQYVPAAWKLLKAKYPDVQFGLSDCVNFWLPGMTSPEVRDEIQFKGFDAIAWLRSKGIEPDFFSMHGHHPQNDWSDPRDMYAVLNRFKDAGIRVHVTEEYLRLGGAISGPVRTGILTPELQAEYLERYYTVCFSHPSVDLVNLWGGLAPYGWTNDGLIDSNGNLRPGFDRLKKLFTETWRSHVSQKLALDGLLKSRVFHGTYQLTVTLANGKQLSTKLVVPQEQSAAFKVRMDAAKGTLEVVPG